MGDYMKEQTKYKLKVFGISILIAELVGALSGFLTRNGVKEFEYIVKPEVTPPAIVFPIVWTILFALMGISSAIILLSPPSRFKNHSIIIYVLQLIVNFFWSIFFFNLSAYGFSFFWLLLLIALICIMIYKFYQVNTVAALLQIPYLLWVVFAGYLNFMIWMLNL